MSFDVFFWLSILLRSCFAQSTSSIAGSTATSPIAVTVTSISTLAIIILPSSNSSSLESSVLSTVPATSVSLTSASTTNIALPTNPYTGQAILTGTCSIPQYTGLALQNGAVIEVPLVGCGDNRPECCPSLSPPETSSTETSTPSITGLTATGVISMLSASPLSICPQDFTDIEPVCCPSGYSLFGQAVVGNTPCYSMLSTTVPIPPYVSNSITSAIGETASATATVSVILNQVFALGLPCADQPDGGLSTGAKVGIGVGAGVGGLLLIGLVLFILVRIGRKRLRRRQPAPPISTGYHQPEVKHISTSTTAMSPSVGTDSLYFGQASPQFHPLNNSYGFTANSGFGPRQHHASWETPSVTSGASQYQKAVEMQVPQTHEIGDGERASSPHIQDKMSSTDGKATTSSVSAYEVQRGRSD